MDIGRKNGVAKIDDTDMYYVSFGRGEKKLVVLPGLSDGLATVKGKAVVLSGVYKRFLMNILFICSAGRIRCRRGIRSGIWQKTRCVS